MVMQMPCHTVHTILLSLPLTRLVFRVRELQRRDPALAGIIKYLEWEQLPANNKTAKTILHTIEQYYLDPDGLLCHIWFPGNNQVPTPKSQLVIPAALRHEVLLQVHDIPFSGHLGVNKTCQIA